MGTLFVNKLLQRSRPTAGSDSKPIIYMRSKWLDSEDQAEFIMLLTSNNQNYKGVLKYSELRNAAEELEQPYEEFFDECKKALTTNLGMPGFDSVLEFEEDMPVFKLYKCQGYETLYVEILLTKISNSNQLLDSAIELILGEDRQPGGRAVPPSAATDEILSKYKTYVEQSKKQEQALFTKFLALINTKKKRVEDLERQMEDHNVSISSARKDTNEKYPIIPDNYSNNEFNAETQTLGEEPSSSRLERNRNNDVSEDN